MPSTRVLSTDTAPSSGPGISPENSGLTERSPAITPRSKSTGPSRAAIPSGPVPSSGPAGPVAEWNTPRSSNASTTSDPWFGGASITTRPMFAGRCSFSQPRARIPPIEWVTKLTRFSPHASTAVVTNPSSPSTVASVDG